MAITKEKAEHYLLRWRVGELRAACRMKQPDPCELCINSDDCNEIQRVIEEYEIKKHKKRKKDGLVIFTRYLK